MLKDMPVTRLRRNRKKEALRNLIAETTLTASDLIAPLFVQEGSGLKTAIKGLPETYRLSIDQLLFEVTELASCGVKCVNLFCYVPKERRDDRGSEAYRKQNLMQQAIDAIKNKDPEIVVMTDIALDPFTSHGHDGIVDASGYVLNDETVSVLAEMSLLAAEAGADVVSPSDMMDGRVSAIRKALDNHGFENVSILSYAAKYASSLYGPFREALDSTPQFGDKKSYQMDIRNAREAYLECATDEKEGADLLLIKPALSNLDIISKVRSQTALPVGAYQVSGEWAMIHHAAARGAFDEMKALFETLYCIKRAGADFIFCYPAKKVARAIR